MNAPHIVRRLNDARMAFEGPMEERATLLPTQEALFAAVKAKREELAKARRAGTNTAELEEQARFAVSEAWYLHQEAEREKLEKQFADRERVWKKGRDAAQELLDLKRWEMRYSVMDERELDAEVDTYSADPKGWHPDRAEVLLATVKQRGSAENADSLRRVMEKADYRRPWLHDAPELTQLHRLHSAPFGEIRVLGFGGIEDLAIAQLFDTSAHDEAGRLI